MPIPYSLPKRETPPAQKKHSFLNNIFTLLVASVPWLFPAVPIQWRLVTLALGVLVVSWSRFRRAGWRVIASHRRLKQFNAVYDLADFVILNLAEAETHVETMKEREADLQDFLEKRQAFISRLQDRVAELNGVILNLYDMVQRFEVRGVTNRDSKTVLAFERHDLLNIGALLTIVDPLNNQEFGRFIIDSCTADWSFAKEVEVWDSVWWAQMHKYADNHQRPTEEAIGFLVQSKGTSNE